jgi:hypothetical protein
MKEIRDMNLAELADQIERKLDVPMGEDLVQYDIADRLYAIHNLTRWIPVSERMPTEADADKDLCVLVCATEINSDHQVVEIWSYEYVSRTGLGGYKPTHWQRITPPEGV